MRTIFRKAPDLFFDEETQKEVSLRELAEYVHRGIEFKVVDASSKQDVTASTLAQIIRTQAQAKKEEGYLGEMLKEVIQSGKTAISKFAEGVWAASLGVATITEERLKTVVDQLVESGKVTREKGDELINELREKLKQKEEMLEKKSRETVCKVLKDFGITTSEDLQEKIALAVKEATADLKTEIANLKEEVKKLKSA
ncbi:hypothetical protein DRP98_01145 [candidate division KSB1 bacterium]|nr:MAG: hypothetical protein DRQ12_08505 [candidate division KSB1 bacterium]RKY86164.1 MAG: hypothetical protein DRP98_01145 [candidate division KSB1 bacterium]